MILKNNSPHTCIFLLNTIINSLVLSVKVVLERKLSVENAILKEMAGLNYAWQTDWSAHITCQLPIDLLSAIFN